MTGCWSGKVAGHFIKILIFMSFIFRFNIIFVIRTAGVSAKRYCRLTTIHTSCTLSFHFAQHRTAILISVGLPCKVPRRPFQNIPFFFSAFQLRPQLQDLAFGFQQIPCMLFAVIGVDGPQPLVKTVRGNAQTFSNGNSRAP